MDLVEVNPYLGSQSDVESTLHTASLLIDAFKGEPARRRSAHLPAGKVSMGLAANSRGKAAQVRHSITSPDFLLPHPIAATGRVGLSAALDGLHLAEGHCINAHGIHTASASSPDHESGAVSKKMAAAAAESRHHHHGDHSHHYSALTEAELLPHGTREIVKGLLHTAD